MTTRSIALATALLAIPFAATAQDWQIDASHTSISFSVSHLGFSDTLIVFRDFEGDISFDAENLAATEVNLTIDAASIDSFWAARDAHVRGGDFLDVENHPEITFVSTAVDPTSDTSATLTGDMTIRGVTVEETFNVVMNNIGPNPFNPAVTVAGFTITGVIDRTDYGIGFGAPAIGTDLPVVISTEIMSQ